MNSVALDLLRTCDRCVLQLLWLVLLLPSPEAPARYELSKLLDMSTGANETRPSNRRSIQRARLRWCHTFHRLSDTHPRWHCIYDNATLEGSQGHRDSCQWLHSISRVCTLGDFCAAQAAIDTDTRIYTG
jgi:hypothetical protein